jgi:hypothetical protein
VGRLIQVPKYESGVIEPERLFIRYQKGIIVDENAVSGSIVRINVHMLHDVGLGEEGEVLAGKENTSLHPFTPSTPLSLAHTGER